MDLDLRVLFQRFQTIFGRMRLTFSVETGTRSTKAIKCSCCYLWDGKKDQNLHGLLTYSHVCYMAYHMSQLQYQFPGRDMPLQKLGGLAILVFFTGILYFPIPHNAFCLPPKFCINYCCEMLLGIRRPPKSISQQQFMQNLGGKLSALWGIGK